MHGERPHQRVGLKTAAVWADIHDRRNVPLAVSLRTNKLNQNKNRGVDPVAMLVGTEHRRHQ